MFAASNPDIYHLFIPILDWHDWLFFFHAQDPKHVSHEHPMNIKFDCNCPSSSQQCCSNPQCLNQGCWQGIWVGEKVQCQVSPPQKMGMIYRY